MDEEATVFLGKGALLELSSGGKRVSLAREGTYSMRAVAGATESTTKPGILEALGGELRVIISGHGEAGSIRRLPASALAMQGRQATALGVLRGGEREDSSAVDMLEASQLLAAGAPKTRSPSYDALSRRQPLPVPSSIRQWRRRPRNSKAWYWKPCANKQRPPTRTGASSRSRLNPRRRHAQQGAL